MFAVGKEELGKVRELAVPSNLTTGSPPRILVIYLGLAAPVAVALFALSPLVGVMSAQVVRDVPSLASLGKKLCSEVDSNQNFNPLVKAAGELFVRVLAEVSLALVINLSAWAIPATISPMIRITTEISIREKARGK